MDCLGQASELGRRTAWAEVGSASGQVVFGGLGFNGDFWDSSKIESA